MSGFASALKIFVVASLCCGWGSVGSAEGLVLLGKKKSKGSILNSQMALLDGKLAKQYENSSRLKPGSKKAAVAEAKPARFSGSYKGAYLQAAKAAARKYGVPEDTFLRLVQQESGWKHSVSSPKGAHGLAQLMPATARQLGVNINDPEENLEGGARYLRMMYDRFGSWRLALAAYNAGPGAVEKHGGIPPFAETKHYVKAILG